MAVHQRKGVFIDQQKIGAANMHRMFAESIARWQLILTFSLNLRIGLIEEITFSCFAFKI